eukprot:NODE_640_length_2872_cov_11.467031.p1 GENE.NODE_640_length_2872_cov_11.467031~~NODE_640_length_2872_cov_11.467031.p1  ORF type:complete len:611 (-),score=93.26 NODE_640_length_2872_cov_11.467031:412-2244(-)
MGIASLLDVNGTGESVLALSDALNHASMIRGLRLSGACVRCFAHNDMISLEAQLQRAVADGQPGTKEPWRDIYILVEGLYSMDGDFCRLREIVALKKKYGARIYLDEAHCIGATGRTGRGITELFEVPVSEVDVMMGTFSKSFGIIGGYVAASQPIIDRIRHNATGSACGHAMPLPCAAHALAAFKLIIDWGITGKGRFGQLCENSHHFRARLEKEGFTVLGDLGQPIMPVLISGPGITQFSRELLSKGIAVAITSPPAVAVLQERARMCLSATHTKEELGEAADAFVDVGRRAGLLNRRHLENSTVTQHPARDAYTVWLRTAPLSPTSGCRTTEQYAAEAVPNTASVKPPRASSDVVKGRDNWCFFDPLNYAANPPRTVVDAAEAAFDNYGVGSCGPRVFYGTSLQHLDLEAALVSFLHVDSALVYPGQSVTMDSVIPALVMPGDHIIIDDEASYGARAGVRLCKGATIAWVRHGSIDGWWAALRRAPTSSRTFMIVEAISPRTGRVAPLVELLKMKAEHGAVMILDETLSFGVLGSGGRGLIEEVGAEPASVDAIVGSLEHALPGMGGFCAGQWDAIRNQHFSGAGYLFSCSAPAAPTPQRRCRRFAR